MAVTPSTGKTHIRYCRFLVDGANLSGDMRTISSFGLSSDQADATGWSNSTRQWLNGWNTVLLDGLTAVFSNDAETTGPIDQGSHTELAALEDYNASVFIGIRAAPTIGNPTMSAVMTQNAYNVMGGGSDAVMVEASFMGAATSELSSNIWGVCLADGTALSATGSGGSVDNAAASTGGYIAFLHIPQTTGAIASNTWAFIIEHSANDSSWSTLASFTLDGSAINSERLEGSGTVNRYVRFTYTRTAGTARPWVSFIRKA